jgi:ribonuclease HIII
MVTFENIKKKDLDILLGYGFSEEKPKSEYELARYAGPCTLVLYKSGKLIIQGSENESIRLKKVLEKLGVGKEIAKTEFKEESGIVIGSDETLKGDTFGGLIVAAVKADDSQREILRKLNVDDSKKIDDKHIPRLAQRIKESVSYSIKNIVPEEYNKAEVTPLLNQLHKGVKEDLGQGTHIVDKYPGCMVGDIIVERAESKYLEVAAASIIARDEALKQLKELSEQAGFEVPKGSTHVIEGLRELKKRGLDFDKFVKTGFRNVRDFLENSG